MKAEAGTQAEPKVLRAVSLHNTTQLELKDPVLGRPLYSGFHTVALYQFFSPL